MICVTFILCLLFNLFCILQWNFLCIFLNYKYIWTYKYYFQNLVFSKNLFNMYLNKSLAGEKSEILFFLLYYIYYLKLNWFQSIFSSHMSFRWIEHFFSTFTLFLFFSKMFRYRILNWFFFTAQFCPQRNIILVPSAYVQCLDPWSNPLGLFSRSQKTWITDWSVIFFK